jgi:hypothetical protein
VQQAKSADHYDQQGDDPMKSDRRRSVALIVE